MANKYEDPTQRLVSHNWSDEYKENYEKIFGKKETWLERRERENQIKSVCPKCNLDLSKPLGYVCPSSECPIQAKVTC